MENNDEYFAYKKWLSRHDVRIETKQTWRLFKYGNEDIRPQDYSTWLYTHHGNDCSQNVINYREWMDYNFHPSTIELENMLRKK